MKFNMCSGDLLQTECGALVVGVYKDHLTPSAQAINEASGGQVERWKESGDIHGCVGKCAVFRGFPGVKAERVIFVGLGKDGDVQDFRRVLNLALEKAYLGKDVILTTLEWLPNSNPYWIAEQTGVIACTAYDRPKSYKTFDVDWKHPKEIKLFDPSADELIEESFKSGVKIGNGIQLCKNYADMPANYCTPSFMADECMKLAAEYKLDVTVFDEKALEKLGMGCLLGVSQGSKQPARMVILEYKSGKKSEAPYALIGKGLTFDSGGISLKPGKGMDEMKYDMCGAAAMIAAVCTAAALKLEINVVAAVGLTENMPGGAAVKPGDILTSYLGKTVEVLNTDAEGRLVLCDLLAYVNKEYQPVKMIDAATLTGACVIALGNNITGMFANKDEYAKEIQEASEAALDPCWRLPLGREFHKALRSNFADLANISDGRGAGSSTAAAFLEEFVGKTEWAHLDIAGTAWKSGKEKGATGRPVHTLVNLLRAYRDELRAQE